MESIETLWLRYNKISKVSPDIGKLKRLKMIDLRENKITELPKEIGQIQSLSILLMSSNHLKNLPTGIIFYSNLIISKTTNLQRNKYLQNITSWSLLIRNNKFLYIVSHQLNSINCCTKFSRANFSFSQNDSLQQYFTKNRYFYFKTIHA